MKEVLHPESQSPNGVKFHFIDIYLDELSKVGGKEVRNNPMSASSVMRPQLTWTGLRASLFRSSCELECNAVGGPLHCQWQSMNQFNLAFDTFLPHLRMCPKQLMRHVGMIHALRMCMQSNLGNIRKHLHGPVKNLRTWGNAQNTEFLKSSRKERQ